MPLRRRARVERRVVRQAGRRRLVRRDYVMVVVGNYVVLGLFVAILLSGLEADDDEDLERKERKEGHHQAVKDVAEEAVSSPLLIALAQSKRRGSYSLPPPGSEKGCKRWLWDRRDHALLCLSPDSCLRRCALALINFKCSSTGLLSAVSFDNMIILIILTSSGAMAFESCDLDPASPLAERLERINLVATAIFVAEMTLKILALGLAFAQRLPKTGSGSTASSSPLRC